MTRPPEDFLSRWSRRKHQAAKEASLSPSEPKPVASQEDGAAVEPQPPAAPDPAQQEPLFDLSKLPSLDSIGPDTDIRVFMQPGVPQPLARAALRRAWSADPAIRDFIGLSENSWDFTKPDAINGFGPLLPVDDVKKLLAQVFRAAEPNDADENSAALQHETHGAAEQGDASQEPEIESNSAMAESDPAALSESLVHCTNLDPVPHQEEREKVPAAAGSRRRHGGALPI